MKTELFISCRGGNITFVSDNLVLNATQAPESYGFIVLNGTDANGSNAGDNIDMEDAHDIDTARLITEDSYVSQIGEARQNAGEKIIIEENRSSALQLGQIGSFTFEDFIRRDKIIIENNFDINPLEFKHHIVLEESTSPIALEDSEFFIELEEETRYKTNYRNNGQWSQVKLMEKRRRYFIRGLWCHSFRWNRCKWVRCW